MPGYRPGARPLGVSSKPARPRYQARRHRAGMAQRSPSRESNPHALQHHPSRAGKCGVSSASRSHRRGLSATPRATATCPARWVSRDSNPPSALAFTQPFPREARRPNGAGAPSHWQRAHPAADAATARLRTASTPALPAWAGCGRGWVGALSIWLRRLRAPVVPSHAGPMWPGFAPVCVASQRRVLLCSL